MAAKDTSDPILFNEQRLKNQKQIVQNLHKQLKTYNEAFRHFLSAERVFFDTLDTLCESGWDMKPEFSMSLQSLGNITENGARSLETIPVEETIVFKDQFGPYEKEILDYKDKQKIADVAEKKHVTYMRKKSADADELRKLELIAYEKKTSLGILRRKLTDELPTFYKSRMDYYSTFWRSIFQIRADIARAECETLDQLTELVRRFDVARKDQEDATLTRPQDFTTRRTAAHGQSFDADGAYDAAPTSPDGDDSSVKDARAEEPPAAVGIRRVPTFGGNDMSGENGRRSKPPVPRRSSLRSQSKD